MISEHTTKLHPLFTKALAAFVGCMYLVAYLGTFLHMMEAPHVVCEHGQLVHADHEEASEQLTEEIAAADTSNHHQHCDAEFVLKSPRLLPEAVLLPTPAPVHVGALDTFQNSAPMIRAPSHQILRFAPKTSPPIA